MKKELRNAVGANASNLAAERNVVALKAEVDKLDIASGLNNFKTKIDNLDIDKLIPDVSGLVGTTILGTQIEKVENETPDFSGIVTTIVDTKIEKLENKSDNLAKCFTTPELNKVGGTIFDAKLKQVNLATNHDLNVVSHCFKKLKKK